MLEVCIVMLSIFLSMLHRFLVLCLLCSSLVSPAKANSESGEAHLVLVIGAAFNQMTSVTQPMSSIEQCRVEGNKATKRNKKHFAVTFWCIQK